MTTTMPATASAGVIETHTAYVFFVGDRAYKLKKPEDFGFLDHRTREARHRSCRDEVELNARFAPDVYLDLLDVSGSDGTLVDHLVAMRRMPDDRRLTRCLDRGEDLDSPLRAIAHVVATVHESSPRSTHHDANARRDAVAARWTQSFEQIAGVHPERDDTRPRRIEDLVGRYLAGRADLFDQRVADGRIRDGHGDLQADDIFVLDDGPRVLDCIEFGADYRWGDVLADVAFLAMDLERLGRPDLGDRFLALHREHTGDRWPLSLAHHYIAYRAHIRAKVTMLRDAQHGARLPGADVDVLLDLALRHLEAGQVRIVLVGGLPGTGKSTLASALGESFDAVVLRTDEIRRRQAGRATDYSPAAVAAVYRELLHEADRLTRLGESVILDASWADPADRRLARSIAERTHGTLGEIECVAPRAEAADRIRRRLRVGDDPSEATPSVASAMAHRFGAWPEAQQLSTSAAPELVAEAARTLLANHRR